MLIMLCAQQRMSIYVSYRYDLDAVGHKLDRPKLAVKLRRVIC